MPVKRTNISKKKENGTRGKAIGGNRHFNDEAFNHNFNILTLL